MARLRPAVRRIQHTQLYFQEGTSDKVYEVDLCEAGEGEFLVNFRYGRRGQSLKEGTKTPFPESEASARAKFERLVEEKKRKGYQEGAAPEKSVESAKVVPPGGGGDFQRQKVREHLRQAVAGSPPPNWKLSRLVWRAGELGLRDSVPLLIQLSGQDEMTDYSLAWALGRCASEEAVPTLRQLRQHGPPKVIRIATEALLLCLEGGERDALLTEIQGQLPKPWLDVLEDAEALKQIIAESLQSKDVSPSSLFTLYQVAAGSPSAREAVYDAVENLPLTVPYFQALRHLFKAAELRLDAELYGLLIDRFERTPENYRYGWGVAWDPQTRKSIKLAEEQKKPETKYAYSDRTRRYLRIRNIRTLKRAGEIRDAATYITLATGVLMAYDDEKDQREPWVDRTYRWVSGGGYQAIETHYDDCSSYLGFNFLLYTNSNRYGYKRGASHWYCLGSFQPGQPAPETREEAYPELWDQAPDALMHLLRNSRSRRVHEFAGKVWRANPSFREHVETEFVLALLGQRFEGTQGLGVELAREIYDPSQPDLELIEAMAGCGLEEGRLVGLGWLRTNSTVVVQNVDFATRLLLIPFADTHLGVRDILGSVRLSDEFLSALLPKVIAELLSLSADESSGSIARQTSATLLEIAPQKLGEISYEVVRDLLRHPLAEVQELGGQIVLQKPGNSDDVPDDVFHALLAADAESVRVIGMQVFGKLSDAALLARSDMLTSFCLSEQMEVREAARPIVERLAKQDASFGREVVLRFYPILLRKEDPEGMHEDVYALLEGPLVQHLDAIPLDSTFRMLESRYRCGQLLGLLMLKKLVNLKDVRMSRLASLASAETQEVREFIWNYFRANPDRIRRNREDAVRILDSDWEDTRHFAFDYFRDTFSEEDWDPGILVSLCDSIRPDVQDYGRDLITRYFRTEDGPKYLLKLSQHPSPNLQMFASNYLERFASDDVEKLESLEWYLLAVLSQVNRSRVAKARVLRFLETEALKSERAAELISKILTRQSATIAIQDKASILQSLLAISKRWPSVEVPFQRKPLAVASID